MEALELKNDKIKSFFNDRYVWLLLIISLSVRIYLSFFTYVIQNDSVAFMQNAKFFADGDFLSGLGHDYHPLYSLIMAVVYKVIPNMELSGTIVSLFFSTLTVIVFYLIGKSVFDRKISFVSAIILAFHPYAVRFSADIISESTYFFFFISALGLGYFAITNRKLLLFALTGICSALAYLTRPEGIGIIIVVAFWCALKDCVEIKVLWKEKLVSILILVVSFLVFSTPYLVFIKKETGSWSLTKKKNVSDLAGLGKVLATLKSDRLVKEDSGKRMEVTNLAEPGKVLDALGNDRLVKESSDKKKSYWRDIIKQMTSGKSNFKIHLNGILHVIKKYVSTFHPFLLIFLIIGVINWTRVDKKRFFGIYVTSIILFYLIILYRLNLTYLGHGDNIYQYPSRRHLMPLVIPAVFFVGLGVYAAGAWIHEKFHNCHFIVGFKELLKSTWIVQLIVLIIVVSVLLPKTLKPQRFDKHGIKVVGQWIKTNSRNPSPVILSDSSRNAYYAGGEHAQMYGINDALGEAQARKADYIIIMQRDYEVMEKELLQYIKDKKITLAYKYSEKNSLNKHSVFLYEVLH
ncbi:MAG: glycosyltransferase family 39 protein [Candidatus Scalindua sp.]|nr:glycosyltransferase family 39 protein [Candidatus Scalindua sp.]MCR4344257.1 glycosyltransferase family 39 protein [Candidatus Scalindua sp.]